MCVHIDMCYFTCLRIKMRLYFLISGLSVEPYTAKIRRARQNYGPID
jgi:hypothetical protein